MCGIAGIVDHGSTDERSATVRRMTAAIAHRGPDGEGHFSKDQVSLGHRRLSIIDLESGQQPLCNEDESIWLTFNGELYNYRELRESLILHGHVFKSHSDSEVIVHAYEEWGADCVKQFRGMFAFAIADLKSERVVLARDHLGIKPLYYRVHRGQLAFASELPALLQACANRPRTSAKAIEYFLRYRYIPAPDTVYESIFKLPPATYQVYDFGGNKLAEREYWQLSFEPTQAVSSEDWLQEFECVLMDSVKAHLVADVPFGAFLSGGIDSTLIVACMAQLLNHKVRAYTIGFDEETFSEHKFAAEAADRLGVELRHEVVRPDVVHALQKLFTNYGEPFADTSAVPTWWVSELARRDVPMVLSGDGADEAFAGYHRYGRWLDDTPWADTRNVLRYPKRLLGRIAESYRHGIAGQQLRRWQHQFVGVLDRPSRLKLWPEDQQHLVDLPCPAFVSAGEQARRFEKLSFAQYIDIKTYLPGDILTKVDVASMQHGLEVRTPFTDVRVFEFAATLPYAQRVDNSKEDRRLKALPKRALSKEFPADFVDRNKMGFAIPEADWMSRGNPVRACFDDLLSSSNACIFDYLERSVVEEMTSEFDSRGVHATALWSLFSLAFWAEQNSAAALKAAA